MVVYVCPRCDCNQKTINALSLHLKLKHSSTSYNTVCCKQDRCLRVFNDVYSFKKHLKNKHSSFSGTKSPIINKLHVDFTQQRNEFFDNVEINNTNNNPANTSNIITDTKSLETAELNNKSSIPSLSELKKALTESSSIFIANLYSNPKITKRVIQDIVTNTTELFNFGFDILKQVHKTSIESRNDQQFNEMLDTLANPFEDLETEYKREQYLENAGYLIRPSAFFIGTEETPGEVDNMTTVKLKSLTGQIIPLRIVLQKFLELPNVLNTIDSYIDDCMNNNKITSFLNGRLWLKLKKDFPHKFIIPLMLFFDDLEINNSLGSHKGINKIGAVYCRILAVPPQYSSMTENIFLVQFHKSHHLRQFGNRRIFEPLVQELKFLENTGISVKTEHGNRNVHFILSLFAGDNLGIHTIFGFNESFKSTFYCHLCRLDKNFLQVALTENVSELRTKENFQNDLKDLSHGIKEDSIFHEMLHFHITQNMYCDVMHDVLEGICRYVLAKVFNTLINIDKLFTLDILNYRIRFFHYGSAQASKYVPLISKDALKKGIFICSASEMKLLLENLGFIIGDLVPENNAVWELYITLREIHCLLMKNSITENNVEILRIRIAKHHELYQKLMNEPLKPKFHFLTHYPTVILNNGPIYAISCMRFEGKHKEFKENSQVIRTRKNICYSLAMKNQMSFAERLQANKGFQDRLQLGVNVIIKLDELPNYVSFKYFVDENQLKEYDNVVSSVQINGTNYKSNMILVINEDNGTPEFGKIVHIHIRQ